MPVDVFSATFSCLIFINEYPLRTVRSWSGNTGGVVGLRRASDTPIRHFLGCLVIALAVVVHGRSPQHTANVPGRGSVARTSVVACAVGRA